MVLVRTFIAVIKHHDQKQLGEERVSFSVQFHNTLITEGSQGRHLRQELIKRPQRGAAYWQPAILYTPTHQHHQTKGGPVHSEQGPFSSIISLEQTPQAFPQPNLVGAFSQLK